MKNENIGFIQGRLSPIVNGLIQAFPWNHWKEEIKIACENEFKTMEWTLDLDRIEENPFMTEKGQREIHSLLETYGMKIPSLTGDFFMHAPYFKAEGSERERLLEILIDVIKSCGKLGVTYLIIPLVDNGSLATPEDEMALLSGLDIIRPHLEKSQVKIAFESDYPPKKLLAFINKLDQNFFGINYDSGNSAALGFDPTEEFEQFGHRVFNVHIKDRILNGTTVPLGQGNADLKKVCHHLKAIQYNGPFILQTARANDGKHLEALNLYREQLKDWYAEAK